MLGSVVLAAVALQLGACKYTESLHVRPLTGRNALATFDFEMKQHMDREEQVQSYTTFPRSLGQIMSLSNTEEMHMRFGQGWWDAEEWGSPPNNGQFASGIGIELWAWVHGSSESEAWQNWRQLTHSLGGYFCASVNFIDEKVTTFPSESIHTPWGHAFVTNDFSSRPRTWLMRGALPAEPICTENLTPFLKLLPCRGKAGISSLLDGHSLFRSRWQSMSVDVWNSGEKEIALKQTVTNVVNLATCQDSALPYAVPKEDLLCDHTKPYANDWTCFPVVPKTVSYKLSELFGRPLVGACALAEKSSVVIDAPANWQVNHTDTKTFQVNELLNGSGNTLDLEISTLNSQEVKEILKPPLLLDRSFSGWGQQRGGIRTVFTNNGDLPLRVNYFESSPWFMRVYLHTLRSFGLGSVVKHNYIPSRDRGRPTQLEIEILLPAHARFELEYRFDKSLLYLREYPPDANHGFEVPPGLAIARLENTLPETGAEPNARYEVRTSSLLLSLPVPDFSMPYNVIILTSTAMAFAFATIFNLMSRDVCPISEAPPAQGSALRSKLLALFNRRRKTQ